MMQERGSTETKGSSEGSVAKDCFEEKDCLEEGKDDENEHGAKSVQPKTPVLRKVLKED